MNSRQSGTDWRSLRLQDEELFKSLDDHRHAGMGRLPRLTPCHGIAKILSLDVETAGERASITQQAGMNATPVCPIQSGSGSPPDHKPDGSPPIFFGLGSFICAVLGDNVGYANLTIHSYFYTDAVGMGSMK